MVVAIIGNGVVLLTAAGVLLMLFFVRFNQSQLGYKLARKNGFIAITVNFSLLLCICLLRLLVSHFKCVSSLHNLRLLLVAYSVY